MKVAKNWERWRTRRIVRWPATNLQEPCDGEDEGQHATGERKCVESHLFFWLFDWN